MGNYGDDMDNVSNTVEEDSNNYSSVQFDN